MIYQEQHIGNGLHLVRLSGPLNGHRAEQIRQQFSRLAGQGIKQVIVDLAEVPLMDGRGLSALVAGYRSFGSQAQNFRLAALQDQPRLLFALTGFDRIFQLFERVEHGLAA